METEAGHRQIVAAAASRKLSRQLRTDGVGEKALDRCVNILVGLGERRGRLAQPAPHLLQSLLDGATLVRCEPSGLPETAGISLVDADLFRRQSLVEIDGTTQPLQGRRGLLTEPASPELQWRYPVL